MNRKDIREIFGFDFERDISIALKVVEYFESRSCSGCKYWQNEECTLLVYTSNFCDRYEEDRCITTEADFSCNKWSNKDEERNQR